MRPAFGEDADSERFEPVHAAPVFLGETRLQGLFLREGGGYPLGDAEQVSGQGVVLPDEHFLL